jgi:hypothetical protein
VFVNFQQELTERIMAAFPEANPDRIEDIVLYVVTAIDEVLERVVDLERAYAILRDTVLSFERILAKREAPHVWRIAWADWGISVC